MAEITGTVKASVGGKSYDLRLTFSGIASLQDEFGDNIAGLLDDTAGDIPNFKALIALVSVSLKKCGLPDGEDADELADDILSSDMGIVARLIDAAFPKVGNGNGAGAVQKGGGKGKKRRKPSKAS